MVLLLFPSLLLYSPASHSFFINRFDVSGKCPLNSSLPFNFKSNILGKWLQKLGNDLEQNFASTSKENLFIIDQKLGILTFAIRRMNDQSSKEKYSQRWKVDPREIVWQRLLSIHRISCVNRLRNSKTV